MASPTTSLNPSQITLRNLVSRYGLLKGEFTLASGRRSNFYLDVRRVSLRSGAVQTIGQVLNQRMPAETECVGGMSLGADPLVTACLCDAAEVGWDGLRGFLIRKEPKQHGTQQYLEGPVEPGMKAVIVEDVVTTGGSAMLAVQRAREFGLEVLKVVGLVDRLEGGAERFAQEGLDYESVLTIADLGIEPIVPLSAS